MSDTLERVQKVVVDVLKADPSRVTPESHFAEDLGAESIQSVELIAAFEEEFDIELDEDDAMKVKNVQEAAAFIDTIIAEEGS
jgi:acyl carrier protein